MTVPSWSFLETHSLFTPFEIPHTLFPTFLMNDPHFTEVNPYSSQSNELGGAGAQLDNSKISHGQITPAVLTSNTMTTAGHSDRSKLVSRSEENIISISSKDIIIAVMGPTGSGKSSFINLATGHDQVVIGHDLRSCTHEVQAFRCPHPQDNGRSVVFIDTPGFDDTNTKDTDILQSIADWLENTYKNGIVLTGLLFLHRITDNRMAGTPLRNLHMFERLCGVDALQNVMLVTTMWEDVHDKAIGIAHEEELKAKYWNSMLNVGSRILRFEYTRQSAWTIIDQFTGIRRVPLQLQVELVDEGKSLAQTAAGSALYQWLESIITQLRELLAKLMRGHAKSQEEIATRGKLQHLKVQKKKLFLDSPRRTLSAPPESPSRVLGQTLGSDSSWSLPNLPNFDPWTDSVPTSEPIAEPSRRGKLAATILALRHAQGIANMTPFAPLKGAVGLSLTVAESVEAMKRTEQALVSLAETAGRLIVGIADNVHNGDVPEDTQRMVRDLITELQDIQKLVTRKGSRRGRVRRYILQSADAELVAACTERLHAACHLFEIKNAINTRAAIARMEARMAEQHHTSPPVALQISVLDNKQYDQ